MGAGGGVVGLCGGFAASSETPDIAIVGLGRLGTGRSASH